MQSIKVQTSQNIELSYALAGVGDRIIAYIIDLAIYFAYYFFIFLLHDATKAIFNNSYISFLVMLPVIFYSLFCEIFMNGQTIGKKSKRHTGDQPKWRTSKFWPIPCTLGI